MYLDFFQLKEHPFQITPDSDFLYLSEAHARAKAYMDYTIRNRDGFVIITGEVGAGKTTLLRKLLSEFDDNVLVAKIFQTQLDETEFLQAVLVEFGLNPFNAKKVELMDMLSNFLIQSFIERKQLVLIVDEAQNLSPRVLEEIRMLSGLETQKQKILHVILMGQPELNATLEMPEMEQLLQRVRLRFHISALTEAETHDYIIHRLHKGGAPNARLFPDDAIPLIYQYTGGIPRLINTLCDTTLMCAFADDTRVIAANTVMLAIEELQWPPYDQRPKSQMKPRTNGVSDPTAHHPVDVHSYNDAAFNVLLEMARRLESIEALLKSTEALLQRKNRISIRFGRNQLAQIIKQFTLEMERARTGLQ